MVHDPRIQKLLDSRHSGEHDRLRQMEIEAAEAWWQSLAEEQRLVYIALGYDAWFFLMEKARKLQRKEPEGALSSILDAAVINLRGDSCPGRYFN